MKAVLDVHYRGGAAMAACGIFEDWPDSIPAELFRAVMPIPAPYRVGRFYERELPALLSVLSRTGREFETIVIDGYVHLRPDAGRGLGVHLHDALAYSPVVVGVAKNPLKIADRFLPIHRGRSRRPLYISSIGCPLDQAARAVLRMHGSFRIPTLLKIVDRYAGRRAAESALPFER